MYFIRYYYFRIFKLYAKKDEIPYVSCYLLMAAFSLLHILTILALLNSFLVNAKLLLPNTISLRHLSVLMIYLPLYFIYNKMVIKSGLHNKILQEFENETNKQKNLSIVFTILYFVLSIAFFVGTLWLRQKYKGY